MSKYSVITYTVWGKIRRFDHDSNEHLTGKIAMAVKKEGVTDRGFL